MYERPFDARFVLLRDRSGPASSWRTVSLVTAMREFLSRDPNGVIPNAEQQCELLGLCVTELTDRGLDANCLIRFGLFPEVVAGVIGPYVVRKLSGPMATEGPATLSESRSREWDALLDELLSRLGVLDAFSSNASSDDRSAALGQVVTILGRWVQNAGLRDLIALQPPSLDWLDLTASLELDVTLWSEYRWAVDRFSMTSLEEWNLASLHLEYRWLTADALPPCSPDLMQDRSVELSAVEREIARRAVAPQRDVSMPEVRASLAARMQAQALGHLRAGRFDSAATLFEFAVAEDPSDASARNNLGFCLLPSDPDAAWQHLRESVRLGYEPFAINLYNRVLCLALLGDTEYALRLAEDEWDALEPDRGLATLWILPTRDVKEVRLAERVNAIEELARLGVELSMRRGEPERANQWQTRMAA